MNTDHDSDLLKIAEKVSDAEPVDWDDASCSHPALEPALAGLQRVEAVADAFRAASAGDPGPNRRELRTWARLDVLELIGEGSFGEVYRARDRLLDREVALKLRKRPVSKDNENDSRRALDEGRRLARVRHPNVLTVHGADVDQGRVGLWTELIDGANLRDIIGTNGALEPDEAVSTTIAVCRALRAVHGADLVHGDVKSSNIFRDIDGRIVLGDFGSASELDATGTVSGSPVTLAPERLRGAAAEPPSDVYSVGVLLYFMLSGRYPVEGVDVQSLLEQHETAGPIPLSIPRPDLPQNLVDLVDRAVARDPARRFTTAGELEHALAEVGVADEQPTSVQEKTKTPEPPNPRSIRIWSGVLAIAVLAIVVFLGRAALSPTAPELLLTDATLMLDAPGGPVALENGSAIAPGDHLYLEIEAAAPVHIYVANEDEAGAVFTLFPIPGLDLGNPLPTGRHRLPGTIGGAANDWRVTSAGGVETFLVIAASAPIPEIEQHISAWAAASADRAASAISTDRPTLRGVGGLSVTPGTAGDGGNRLDKLQEQLSLIEEDGRTFWSRRIVLNSSQSR